MAWYDISFSDYFQYIGYRLVSEREMVLLLRESVANSRLKHYHGGKSIEVLSPEGIKSVIVIFI